MNPLERTVYVVWVSGGERIVDETDDGRRLMWCFERAKDAVAGTVPSALPETDDVIRYIPDHCVLKTTLLSCLAKAGEQGAALIYVLPEANDVKFFTEMDCKAVANGMTPPSLLVWNAYRDER